MEQITTHLSDAAARLLQQFKDKPKLRAILDAVHSQIQDIEDAGFPMIESMRLQNAEGATLNKWGQVLDVPRNGRTDTDYRTALFFSVLENIAAGAPNDILENVQNLFQGEVTQIFEYFPAAFSVSVINTQNIDDAENAKELINRIRPAGVALLFLVVGDNDQPLSFQGFPLQSGMDDYLSPQADAGIFTEVF